LPLEQAFPLVENPREVPSMAGGWPPSGQTRNPRGPMGGVAGVFPAHESGMGRRNAV